MTRSQIQETARERELITEIVRLKGQIMAFRSLTRALGSCWRMDDMRGAGEALAQLEYVAKLHEQGGS